jgi:hypothetical protein
LTKEEWELGKAQSQTEDAKQAIELKMVPSKAEGMPALPQAFKEESAAVEKAEAVAEPVKRPAAKAKPEAPAATKNVSDILSDWATDDDA